MSSIDLHKFADVIFGMSQKLFTLHHQTWANNI